MGSAGALVGAAVAVAYLAIRVNLLPSLIDTQYLNEAAVFALALLGRLCGVKSAAA